MEFPRTRRIGQVPLLITDFKGRFGIIALLHSPKESSVKKSSALGNLPLLNPPRCGPGLVWDRGPTSAKDLVVACLSGARFWTLVRNLLTQCAISLRVTAGFISVAGVFLS